MATSSARSRSLFKRRVIPWQDPAVRAAIGEELRRPREAQGQTLANVAKGIDNIPVNWLQAVENGYYPPIEREYGNVVTAYAQHIGLDLSEFEVGYWRTWPVAAASVAILAALVLVIIVLTRISSPPTVSPQPATATATLQPTETQQPTAVPTDKPPVTASHTLQPTGMAIATREPTPASSPSEPTGTVAPTIALNPKDGAEYVYIETGAITMGSQTSDPRQFGNERPTAVVDIGSFRIKRTEVTNWEYQQCVEDDEACTAPNNGEWDDPTYANYPVTNVTWEQANEYARWVGGRLPTEAEWEKACRGMDGRVYPWGNAFPSLGRGNFNSAATRTKPVGLYSPTSDSPYGLVDMAGNVWEWTNSLDKPYPYRGDDGREEPAAEGSRVQRGGSFMSDDDHVRCAVRNGAVPDMQQNSIGFRVVWPVERSTE